MSALALLAEAPALPLHEAGKYVAAAYVVLFALVLVYMGIMAIRQSKLERDLAELLARERDPAAEVASRDSAHEAERGAGASRSQRESTLA